MDYLKRRECLRGCIGAIPLLSGYISFVKYDGSSNIVLDNASDISYQVTVQLSDSGSGDEVFEETYGVEAQDRIFESEIVDEGVYDIRATIEEDANSDVDFSTSETEFELACEEDRYDDDAEVTLVILLDPGYSISIRKTCKND